MIFKIAVRNSIKNWRHSLSALLSLSASFVSLVIFDGYIDDVNKMYLENYSRRQMLGDLIVENVNYNSDIGKIDPWAYSLTDEDQNSINDLAKNNFPEIKTMVKNLNFKGIVTNGQQTQIFIGRGIDLKEGALLRGSKWAWNINNGKPLDYFQNENVLALGMGLSEKLNCHWDKSQKVLAFYGDVQPIERPFDCLTKDLQLSTTTSEGQLNAIDLQVGALINAGYKDIDNRYIQTSLNIAQTLTDTTKVSFISIDIGDKSKTKKVRDQLNQYFKLNRPHLRAIQWQDHPMGEMYLKTIDFLEIFRNFMILVLFFVSTLSVVNTMIKIVKERTKEIGAMRSFGFLKNKIIQLFVVESICLSVIGTLFGIFFSLGITLMLNISGITYNAGVLSEPIYFKISFLPFAYLSAFLLLIFVSIVSTLIATRQTVRGEIVENLNYV